MLTPSYHFRFSVLNPPGSDDWVLSIELARMTDLGHYECQVNTEPKINLGFWLNILRELRCPLAYNWHIYSLFTVSYKVNICIKRNFKRFFKV